jgi:hypothetical protein
VTGGVAGVLDTDCELSGGLGDFVASLLRGDGGKSDTFGCGRVVAAGTGGGEDARGGRTPTLTVVRGRTGGGGAVAVVRGRTGDNAAAGDRDLTVGGGDAGRSEATTGPQLPTRVTAVGAGVFGDGFVSGDRRGRRGGCWVAAVGVDVAAFAGGFAADTGRGGWRLTRTGGAVSRRRWRSVGDPTVAID